MVTAEQIEQVFSYWQTLMGHKRSKLDIRRQRVIRDRILDGYTIEDLQQAIRGCAVDPWHMGENERREVFDSITMILRDSDHVDKFIGKGEIADKLLAKLQERTETQASQSELPVAPPTPEQIARARQLMKSVGLRRVA